MHARDRGFGFKTLPTVIDPLTAAIEVELIEFDAAGAELPPRWVVFHRAVVRHDFLPVIRVFQVANIYANHADYTRASIMLGFSPEGVLAVIFYRHADGWRHEPCPEELTGNYSLYHSLRFVFRTREDMIDVLTRMLRLRKAELTGQDYSAMQADAGAVIAALMQCPEGPRAIELADPLQGRSFGVDGPGVDPVHAGGG